MLTGFVPASHLSSSHHTLNAEPFLWSRARELSSLARLREREEVLEGAIAHAQAAVAAQEQIHGTAVATQVFALSVSALSEQGRVLVAEAYTWSRARALAGLARLQTRLLTVRAAIVRAEGDLDRHEAQRSLYQTAEA